MLCFQIGPIILPARLNGPAYLNMLEDDLQNMLTDEQRDNIIFQQDGAGPHYAGILRIII